MTYLTEAFKYATQSKCRKRQVGCVVVRDQQIIAYGFNHGYTEECNCSMQHKNPNVIHAEQMALQGIDDLYVGATLYVTYQPCLACAELIVSKGINTVVYSQKAKSNQSIKFLNRNNVRTYLSTYLRD